MTTPFSQFKSENDIRPYLNDDHSLIYPVCENVLFVANKCIDPFEETIFIYDKNQATVVGLYVKQVMLYKDYLDAYKSNKLHLCCLYYRVIYESFIKMQYLMRYGTEEQKAYRLYSYKDRYDFYKSHINDENGYFKVRNDKFLQDLADDGIEIMDLDHMHRSFGGRNFRQLVEEFDKENLYTSLYGIGSDSIHSDWGDIRQVYLRKTIDKGYVAYQSFDNKIVHFRMLVPLADMLIDSSDKFIDWNNDIDFCLDILSSYKSILNEMKRMCKLIMSTVFHDYQSNIDKFMYE